MVISIWLIIPYNHQVNVDIKNGIVPILMVLGYLDILLVLRWMEDILHQIVCLAVVHSCLRVTNWCRISSTVGLN